MRTIISVDPGVKGALALRSEGALLGVQTMPVYIKKAGARGADRRFIDEARLCDLIAGWALVHGAQELVVEDVGGLPGQSAPGAFNFGYGAGLISMAGVSAGLAIEKIKAAKWKQALRVPADKRAATVRAGELMPQFAHMWATRRGEIDQEQANGMAEAAMLGLYAERYL